MLSVRATTSQHHVHQSAYMPKKKCPGATSQVGSFLNDAHTLQGAIVSQQYGSGLRVARHDTRRIALAGKVTGESVGEVMECGALPRVHVHAAQHQLVIRLQGQKGGVRR